MLKMTQVEYIKFLREQGRSISEIAGKLEINWRTAKKYADSPTNLSGLPPRKRKSPVMGPYMDTVDTWLEEDGLMPTKQRRTATAIYRQLLQLGFEGSDRTVREYVRQRRLKMRRTSPEQFVKLEHIPGEAQVDFGHFKAIQAKDEKVIEYPFLVMSFPYSNASLCRVLPAENSECFLTGLRTMFEEIGGVPREIWFDNLPAAVKKVLAGTSRELTKQFKEFGWHYRFEAKFCNCARGNEKGHVEGKVGYIRRNWMSPMPVIDDIDEFNAYMQKEMVLDRDRDHSIKKVRISELWKHDMAALRQLPTFAFEPARSFKAVVNRYGDIKVDSQTYHVPKAVTGQEVFVKLLWDKLEVFDKYGEERIAEIARDYLGQAKQIDWLSVLQVYRNKPRALERGRYIQALPESVQEYLLVNDLVKRRSRLKTLLNLLESSSMNQIETALEQALSYGRIDEASLKALISYQSTQKKAELKKVPDNWTPPVVTQWRPSLAEYNVLYSEVAASGN